MENLGAMVWSSVCAAGAAVCAVLAVRAVFAGKAGRQVDVPASVAGLLALIGLILSWPSAAQTAQRSALYSALCYSFWFLPDWARHMLDPHTRHLARGLRFRMNLALFGLSGLITLLTLSLLTEFVTWPGGIITGLAGFFFVTVGLMAVFYLWLSSLLLADSDRSQYERAEERRWFWQALTARVGALLFFVVTSWLLWSLTVANGWNKSYVALGGFVVALIAYSIVIWVDSNNDLERKEKEEAEPTPSSSSDAAAPPPGIVSAEAQG